MKRRAFALLAAVALSACGGTVPLPKRGPHVGDTAFPVPTRPPPGKVEMIGAPDPKLKHPVWIDGEWEWTGRRWQWKDPRWEEARPGHYFAPATTVRQKEDGTLLHYAGAWLDGKRKP